MKVERIIELEAELNQLKVGDKITINNAKWKVLEIKDDRILIWKCTKVTDHVFNVSGSNVYEGSDIQKYLEKEFWKEIPADVLGKVTEENFFLLTVDQIRKYMPEELDRIVTREYGQITWYWTATPYVGYGSYVRYIGPSGSVTYCRAIISSGVAPACWLHL